MKSYILDPLRSFHFHSSSAPLTPHNIFIKIKEVTPYSQLYWTYKCICDMIMFFKIQPLLSGDFFCFQYQPNNHLVDGQHSPGRDFWHTLQAFWLAVLFFHSKNHVWQPPPLPPPPHHPANINVRASLGINQYRETSSFPHLRSSIPPRWALTFDSCAWWPLGSRVDTPIWTNTIISHLGRYQGC